MMSQDLKAARLIGTQILTLQPIKWHLEKLAKFICQNGPHIYSPSTALSDAEFLSI